jgi:hypothetical protein
MILAGAIESKWKRLPHHNAVFSIQKRVAVTLHFLCNEGSYYLSGAVFGISKTMAHTYVDEVIKVLNLYFIDTITLPKTKSQMQKVISGFENICGVPNVVGAVDGTLIPIHRFADFEGWYCRKGFPAFNVQVVVNHKKRFQSFSIRTE